MVVFGISFSPLIPVEYVWAAAAVAAVIAALLLLGRSRGALMRTAALALGTLPGAHGFGPCPGRGRIWKLVTAWTDVVAPLLRARLTIRR